MSILRYPGWVMGKMPDILRFLSIPAKYLAADRYSRKMHRWVIDLNKKLAKKLKE